MAKTITIPKGDDRVLRLTFADKNGDPISLSNKKVFLMGKDYYGQPDSEAPINLDQVNHVDATDGRTNIDLDKNETRITANRYICEVSWQDLTSFDVLRWPPFDIRIEQVVKEDFDVS